MNSIHSEFYYQLGISLENQEKFGESEKAYKKALKLNPYGLNYRARLGGLFVKVKNIKKQKKYLELMSS